jgi:Uma2 family endonuclease
MVTTQKLMTAEELAQLPDDGQRYELIEGVLTTMAPSGGDHGMRSARSIISFGAYVIEHDLGEVFGAETGFLLSTNPDTVRAADAAFVNRERALEVGEWTAYWPGAPDLALEVISPNDLYTEVQEKVETWLKYGTRMVIVINPRHRTVAVYRSPTEVRHLTLADTLDGEDVIPGWRAPVRVLFARVK